MPTITTANNAPEAHPWIIAESEGDSGLLGLLVTREGLIDTMADHNIRDTDRDTAKSMLYEINSIIIMNKNALGIETIPPLPPSNESPDFA